MKKILITIITSLIFTAAAAHAASIFPATGLTGGASGDLDAIAVADISDGDGAVVFASGDAFYFYTYDASSSAAESSPAVIKPDDNGGNGRWEQLPANSDGLVVGSVTWDNGSGKIDGEQIADDTIDDDSIDFADVTGGDLTLTDCGQIKSNLAVQTSSGVGAATGADVSVTEYGNGIIHKIVFSFATANVTLTDQAGVVAYGGLHIYNFPAGAVYIIGATSDVDLTKTSAGVNNDWDGDFALGTVTASNNAALSGTEQNILPTTTTPQAASGDTTANGQSTATENAVIDGTTTPVDIYFNLLVDDADHDVGATPCDLLIDGTATVVWINLGDY